MQLMYSLYKLLFIAYIDPPFVYILILKSTYFVINWMHGVVFKNSISKYLLGTFIY
jgi:hypothetical protein